MIQELAGASPISNLLTGLGIDEVWARTDAGGTRMTLADALGSTVAQSDGVGTLQTEFTYEPFGKTETFGSVATTPSQFTGREHDGSVADLYFYRARYYQPEIARFLSEDPIQFDGGINFYVYVDNNPVGFVDPLGLIHYNAPPPRTVPPTGPTLAALQCLERCLQCVTHNPNLDLLITGGAERSGHTRQSHHYRGEAVDVGGPRFNPVQTSDVFKCGNQCGFRAGQFETFANANRNHWHLQLTPGNGVPPLPR